MPNYDNFDTEMEQHYQDTQGGAFDIECPDCGLVYDERDTHDCDCREDK